MNRNTNPDLRAIARAFRMNEDDLLTALHRCIHFLPQHFRQFLQGNAYG